MPVTPAAQPNLGKRNTPKIPGAGVKPRPKKRAVHGPALALGLVVLLSLGGIALFLALRGTGEILGFDETLAYEEIQQRFFTNLHQRYRLQA